MTNGPATPRGGTGPLPGVVVESLCVGWNDLFQICERVPGCGFLTGAKEPLGFGHFLQDPVGLDGSQDFPALGADPEWVVAEEDSLHGERTDLLHDRTSAFWTSLSFHLLTP